MQARTANRLCAFFFPPMSPHHSKHVGDHCAIAPPLVKGQRHSPAKASVPLSAESAGASGETTASWEEIMNFAPAIGGQGTAMVTDGIPTCLIEPA